MTEPATLKSKKRAKICTSILIIVGWSEETSRNTCTIESIVVPRVKQKSTRSPYCVQIRSSGNKCPVYTDCGYTTRSRLLGREACNHDAVIAIWLITGPTEVEMSAIGR